MSSKHNNASDAATGARRVADTMNWVYETAKFMNQLNEISEDSEESMDATSKQSSFLVQKQMSQ